jgi:antitoxin FitA
VASSRTVAALAAAAALASFAEPNGPSQPPFGSAGRPAEMAGAGVVCVGSRCLHNVSMANVLVRDVPEDVHAALLRRAERRGQSLQAFLAGELRRLAERPGLDEVLDRIDQREGGGRVGLGQAVEDLSAERSGR